MLIELLRPGGPELMRRWVAALLLAPRSEREAIVNEVEGRLVELYAEPLTGPKSESETDVEIVCSDRGMQKELSADDESDPTPTVHVVSEATQHDGYVERVERDYSPVKKTKAKKKSSVDEDKKRRA